MPGQRPPPRGAPKGEGKPSKGAGGSGKSSSSTRSASAGKGGSYKDAPRGSSKASPKGASKGASKGTSKDGAKPAARPRPGVSQAAIDASNAARRAGLGGVARKGASQVVAPTQTRAPERPPPSAWERDDWIDEGDVRTEAQGAVARGAKPPRTKTVARDVEGGAPITNLPGDVVADFEAAAGLRDAPKLQQRFANARRAYERERYGEARRALESLARDAPGSAGVRELYGLTLYRLGEYRKAAGELETFRLLSRSTDMNAVLADCYRALHRWTAVEELWAELKAASPDPVVMADGRMVMAGALADRGKLDEAIATLEQGMGRSRKAQPYHLKQWYALADLYERAGDVPRARALFLRVRQVDPTFADVSQRLRTIG